MGKHHEAPPDGIPQNFWDAALLTFAEMSTEAEGADDRVIIAKRLMAVYAVGWNKGVSAEREACAAIATVERDNPFNDSGRFLAGRIAAAIRKRGEGRAMTKHVSGKPRTKRFALMMSPEEFEAIEDFRFANRIGTTAEAVRMLCAEALAAKADVNTAHKISGDE